MKRTLIFALRVPADVTACTGQTQEDADQETAGLILPSLEKRVQFIHGSLTYEGSKEAS